MKHVFYSTQCPSLSKFYILPMKFIDVSIRINCSKSLNIGQPRNQARIWVRGYPIKDEVFVVLSNVRTYCAHLIFKYKYGFAVIFLYLSLISLFFVCVVYVR